MSKPNQTYLVCLLVEGNTPALASWKEICAECGRLVWRAYQLPELVVILCHDCAFQMMTKKENIRIRPISKEQWEQVQQSQSFHNN